MVYLRHYFKSKTKGSNSVGLLDLTNMHKTSHPTVCGVSQSPRYKLSVNKNPNQNKKPTKLQLDKISLLVTVEQNENLEDKLENSYVYGNCDNAPLNNERIKEEFIGN